MVFLVEDKIEFLLPLRVRSSNETLMQKLRPNNCPVYPAAVGTETFKS